MSPKSNPNTTRIVNELKKLAGENKAPVWKCAAELLEKADARWAEVNVAKLEKYAKENSTILIPGKLLGGGEITKPLTVTAFRFSASAKKKIIDAGGKITSILELAESNPKGSGIVIMK
jgi:large subunit ribosomal protein L18e